MILNFANASLRLLLTPRCAACQAPLARPLDGPICDVCWQSTARLTPPYCERCGDALADWRTATTLCVRCRRQPPVFAVARSAGRYDGALRRVIHAFKYDHRRVLAGRLARLMEEAGRDLLDQADAVVPVPLHPWRTLSRGFNQADDLARCLGKPVWRILRRRRHGPPQASLPAGRRYANVRHAYALCRATSRSTLPSLFDPRQVIKGRVLVLVDDVMTTGATLNACSRVLLEGGADSVRALTAARAVAGRPVPRPRSPDPLDAPRR